MAINKKIREEVYKKYDGHCAYCGKEIEYKDMQVDHMYSKAYGESYAKIVGNVELESMENYMPTCRRCNHYKRADSLEQFRKSMSYLHERIESIYIVKVAIDFGILTIKKFDGKFYFEKIEEVMRRFKDKNTGVTKHVVGISNSKCWGCKEYKKYLESKQKNKDSAYMHEGLECLTCEKANKVTFERNKDGEIISQTIKECEEK